MFASVYDGVDLIFLRIVCYKIGATEGLRLFLYCKKLRRLYFSVFVSVLLFVSFATGVASFFAFTLMVCISKMPPVTHDNKASQKL